MNDLINIVPDDSGRQLVCARELHTFIQSKRDFSNWITQRIAKYGFTEGYDFTTNLLNNGRRGKPKKEYYLTLDVAKELSMVENNERGRQARRYFIQCEEELKAKKDIKNADTQFKLASLITENAMAIKELREDLKAMVLKVDNLPEKQKATTNRVGAKKNTSIKSFCNMLQRHGRNMGPNQLYTYLRKHGYFSNYGPTKNAPTQKAIELGLFNEKERLLNLDTQTLSIRHKKMLTPKGIEYFTKKLIGKVKIPLSQ